MIVGHRRVRVLLCPVWTAQVAALGYLPLPRRKRAFRSSFVLLEVAEQEISGVDAQVDAKQTHEFAGKYEGEKTAYDETDGKITYPAHELRSKQPSVVSPFHRAFAGKAGQSKGR